MKPTETKPVPAEIAVAVVAPTRASMVMSQFESEDAKMMALVIATGSIDAMERYFVMKKEMEALACKKEFDRRFAEMQAEYVPVPKSKQGHGYKYCTLEAMQKFYRATVAKFGFSYTFREEGLDNNVKRMWCDIHGYGHTRSNYFDCPLDPGTAMMNSIQRKGVQSTYGQRYALKDGFAFIVGDADPDGRTDTGESVEEEDDGSTDDATCKGLVKLAIAAGLKDKRLSDIRQRYKGMSGSPKSQATIVRILTAEIELAGKKGKPISMVVEEDDDETPPPKAAPLIAPKKGAKK